MATQRPSIRGTARLMTQSPSPREPTGGSEVYAFFALAFAITWLLDLPFAVASIRHVAPPAFALPLVGLGALGPTLAALAIGAWRHELRDIFGRWRTPAIWLVFALLLPVA